MAMRLAPLALLASTGVMGAPPANSKARLATERRQLQIDDRIHTDVAADDSCSITTVFGQLMTIKADAQCLGGCAGGSCPADWYPGGDDTCTAECGLVFEPFWDACGTMLSNAHMGGMEELGLFYDHCLENLYPPDSCGFVCNQHTYDCYIGEVNESCCDERGRNCPADAEVPIDCPVGCAIVFPEFFETCADHVTQTSGLDEQEFATFERECLDQEGIALVEYALDLQDSGCLIDLTGDASDGRRLQSSYLTQYLGSTVDTCSWDDLDDLAVQVDSICCGSDGSLCPSSGGATNPPRSCSPMCAVAMHDFMLDCGSTLETILGTDDRNTGIVAFENQCLDQADPMFFLDAIMNADCSGSDGRGR